MIVCWAYAQQTLSFVECLKSDEKKTGFIRLLDEMELAGVPTKEDDLKKKIKILHGAYRNERDKIKKSGTGSKDLYKPKLIS